MGDIEQFASKVVNFSSQYGTAMSSSYTASNLASGPHIFPNYGDYTDAFVLVSLLLNNKYISQDERNLYVFIPTKYS